MIKLENYEVMGWEHALRGMRNPLNSWHKADSYVRDCDSMDCDECVYSYIWSDSDTQSKGCRIPNASPYMFNEIPRLGPNDLKLAMGLANAGTDHRKFMRMITVYADITAPLYWWKEFDTYKVGSVANSCSTMHKIHEKEFTLDDFSVEKLTKTSLKPIHNKTTTMLFCDIIDALNYWRDNYNETKEKLYWEQMIQLLPSSYNQRRTIMLNYEVLANMYKSRKNHKLDEWREFCQWIEKLPYSELITGKSCEEEDN
jgi:hypothetical protein